MAKKAFLVRFSPVTRVVVDVDKDFNECEYTFGDIVRAARNNMLATGIAFYINSENVDAVVEDVEIPYDPETDD